jgi:NADH-quinone oxidoreductase subunit G
MITIYVDNKPYQVREGQNLLNACLTLGFNLPYFCWHPAMHSVGACRQCAVKQFKDETDAHGKIVMSCMTPVVDGMRISIDDPEAAALRGSVIEWLMINHPHDCPVCDEGGECHLQDMTVMTGHTYRRMRFRKRTHRNQNLGPFINHEMNRCIACYRCVRFYRDYAGGKDLNVFAAHDYVFFGRQEDGSLESEFSGNLVEVCPTGVFTDKTLKRHYTRKWDLQTAPSICVHCCLGCNTIPGERYGSLRRILNRFNHEVNGYFLCDRGRFGYEFVNGDQRIRTPLLRYGNEGVKPTAKSTVLKRISEIFAGHERIIGIGSPRASVESNFALRSLVGNDNFYSGMSPREHHLVSVIIDILKNGQARSPSVHDVEMADAVFILGEDVTNTAPLLDLALHQASRNKPKEEPAAMKIPAWDDSAVRNIMQNEMGPLYLASSSSTKLDARATRTYRAAPDDIARLGFSVAHALNPQSPAVPGLDAYVRSLAQEIANALKNAKRPLIISGTSSDSEATIQAAANIAWALCDGGTPATLCYVVPECNSLGLGLMAGRNLEEAFHLGSDGQIDTIIVLENDLYRRADETAVSRFLSRAKHVIVFDHLINATSSLAEVILPASTFAESDSTLVNNEGRAQKSYRVFKQPGDIQESWKWIHDILDFMGPDKTTTMSPGALKTPDAIVRSITDSLPVFKPILDIAPPASFRVHGAKIPRQPPRYSGRTAITADIDVNEPKPLDDPDSPLSFSMEGYEGQPPESLISRYWSPGWNSVQALNKFQQEVGHSLRGGDPGKRLMEPSRREPASYYKEIPKAFKQQDGAWLIVPLYHIYGSEELSMLSPSVALRTPKPCLAMNLKDAERLGVADGGMVLLTLNAKKIRLPVRTSSTLPAGIVGVMTGMQGSMNFISSLRATIEKK